ncbi:MAG TPA: elongation factor P [Saprospiraceae bacterium]|jgi:elongation factor P|nr:MAG: elongation factor P [Candidatus Parvibacillus calidus]MBX2938345.1 elongation factor P [Saprospiraceae bacterium]MBX7178564.1 elongation factor P [Saprospiraceae bacterium]MCB0590127.1 elongation factor P [Saprospiraceae bacterium]MCC7148723.1 elongation factor P [Saprospiraceae bacterium]
MADTGDIRKGLCIDYNNDIYVVTDFQHVKPARGAAFVRTTLKSMTTGKSLENTWPSGHKLDVVRVERRKFQFLYKDDNGLNLMDNESYEQITISEDMVDSPQFLKESMDVDILYHAEKDIPLRVELPQYINVQVTYSEPGAKGDTATNASKPATIETGAVIKVPLFINEGDVIKIDTLTGAYIERAK